MYENIVMIQAGENLEDNAYEGSKIAMRSTSNLVVQRSPAQPSHCSDSFTYLHQVQRIRNKGNKSRIAQIEVVYL